MIAFAVETQPVEIHNDERHSTMGRAAAALVRSRETSWLTRLKNGDPAAYEEMVRDYSPRMLAVARRMLRSEHDAADAVQDALLSAFASIGRFRGGASLYTWLHRITVNSCLLRLRSRRRRNEVSLNTLTVDDPLGAASAQHLRSACDAVGRCLVRAEMCVSLRRCLDRLPDDYRTIIVLRDLEERDTDETAALLGLSKVNVKTRLHRARRALRTLVESSLNDSMSAA
jgi:RNA polymerase sigma-70 factor (ECF subfamily)